MGIQQVLNYSQDLNIFNLYGEQLQKYFDHYKVDLMIHKTMIGEKAKNIDTLLSIVESLNKFGLYRKVGVVMLTTRRASN